MISNVDRQIKGALEIATRDLVTCLLPVGIVNGTHHFTDLWARDSFFASFGVNRIGRSKFTEVTLELFLSHQKPDGLLPYRILRSPTTFLKYLGRPRYYQTPRSSFRSRQSGGVIPDGGLMAIIAAEEYIRYTGDTKFLKTVYPSLTASITWYLNKFRGGLIHEWFLCEWADSVLKTGRVLYTNVLYYKALVSMHELTKLYGTNTDTTGFLHRAKKIKALINQTFWNGTYFADWVDYKPHQIFSAHANLLAIWFGVPTKEQALSILKHAKEHCWQMFTMDTNYPYYPAWRIPIWNYFVGMGDYHNRGCLWLQPGILYAVCLNQLGLREKAWKILHSIAGQIVKHNGVHEVYERDGKPVNRFFYRAEYPFAWSAGLFVYAYHLLSAHESSD